MDTTMDMIWALALLVAISFFLMVLFVDMAWKNCSKHIYEIINLIEALSRNNVKMRRQIEQIKEKQDGQ
jgi:uncharacterized protein YoxC